MTNLIRAGYEVVDIVTTGEEAVRQTSLLRPDLVLMDIAPAGPMNGSQVAATIWRAHHISIIFLTGHSDIEGVAGTNQANPFAYLSKSCDLKTMVSTIEMAIGKREENVERRQIGETRVGVGRDQRSAVDRRRFPRYRSGDGAMAVSAGIPGTIRNISMGGLSFVFMGSQEPTQDWNSVNIIDPMNNLFLKDLSSRVVLKKILPNNSSFCDMGMIQCSIEYLALLHEQKSDLSTYINKHCYAKF